MECLEVRIKCRFAMENYFKMEYRSVFMSRQMSHVCGQRHRLDHVWRRRCSSAFIDQSRKRQTVRKRRFPFHIHMIDNCKYRRWYLEPMCQYIAVTDSSDVWSRQSVVYNSRKLWNVERDIIFYFSWVWNDDMRNSIEWMQILAMRISTVYYKWHADDHNVCCSLLAAQLTLQARRDTA